MDSSATPSSNKTASHPSESLQSSDQPRKLVGMQILEFKVLMLLIGVHELVFFIRSCIPINYKNWRKVPRTFKDDVWTMLMNEFRFEGPEKLIQENLELDFPEKWRSYKAKLRDYMRKFDSMEDAIGGCPKGVDLNEWKGFVEHESKPEVQEKCKKNSENKRKNVYFHHLGRQTYAQKCHRLDIANPEKKHTRVDGWISGAEKSDGSVSDNIKEKYELVKAANEKILTKCANEGISVNDIPIEEDALSEVFGQDKKSRTRAFSTRISKKQLGRTAISKLYTEHAKSAYSEANKKYDNLEKNMLLMNDTLMAIMQEVKELRHAQPRSNHNTPAVETNSNGVDHTRAVHGNLMNLFDNTGSPPIQVTPTSNTSTQASKNQEVILLSRNGDPVAKGFIPANLGGGTCNFQKISHVEKRVYVTEVIDGMAPIYDAPQNGHTIMQDVTEGGFLIWLDARLKYI